MLQQLSGVSIVLFIAGGVQTVLILFIFAKRQIVRFTLRSRRGPHTPLAYDATKSLRKEITRRIQAVPRIQFEPPPNDNLYNTLNNGQPTSYYYRLKAMKDIKPLELKILQHSNCFKRYPKENMRGFLISTLSPYLNQDGQRMVHEFCDLYEQARHDPSEFRDDEYTLYSKLLLKLIEIRNDCTWRTPL